MLIYLGFRPSDSYQLHEAYSQHSSSYDFKYFHMFEGKYKSLKQKSFKEEDIFKRRFEGMNPEIAKEGRNCL